MVQVLHGLRRFSPAERGWHLRVEGQCPDVVAFAVMIKPPERESLLRPQRKPGRLFLLLFIKGSVFVKMFIMVHFCQYLGIYR